MPLNRPAQALTPGPRGVSDARRWATQVLTEIGRPELVESACISVSEVITNALLHAEQPVSVRLRGTREHPRIEVRDGSREPPDLPDLEADPEDDVLLTFGRGLSIVARVSSAWGAEHRGGRQDRLVRAAGRARRRPRASRASSPSSSPLPARGPSRRRGPRRRHPRRPAAAGDEGQPDAPARAAARAAAAGPGPRGQLPARRLAVAVLHRARRDVLAWAARRAALASALLDGDDDST